MESDERIRQCRQLASEQAAFQVPVRLASPLEEGEDVETAEVEDADQWVAVYSELVEFKRDLLREIDRQTRELGGRGAGPRSSNRRAFMLELRRLQLHLDYWRGRRDELRKHAGR